MATKLVHLLVLGVLAASPHLVQCPDSQRVESPGYGGANFWIP